ncbi:MAG: hypothetical protein PVH88_04115 [Ignavibacteria bacterium]|jgi:hypothetical protein
MKKLKLNMKDLKIESFEITKDSKTKKGTLKGQAPTWLGDPFDSCNPITCSPEVPGCTDGEFCVP